jgi:hypothetical protein
MRTLLAIAALAIVTSGCSTIYFHNAGSNRTVTNYSEWHHDWVFGLVEGSAPVDLNSRCNGANWETVRTRQPFLQGFVQLFTAPVYYPWEASYSCYRNTAAASAPAATTAAPAKH